MSSCYASHLINFLRSKAKTVQTHKSHKWSIRSSACCSSVAPFVRAFWKFQVPTRASLKVSYLSTAKAWIRGGIAEARGLWEFWDVFATHCNPLQLDATCFKPSCFMARNRSNRCVADALAIHLAWSESIRQPYACWKTMQLFVFLIYTVVTVVW